MTKNRAVLQTRGESPRAAYRSEFLRPQNAAILISIQVVLIVLTLDMVGPVVPKLIEGFMYRDPRRPVEINHMFRMAGNR